MNTKNKQLGIEYLGEEDLRNINGGGGVWEFLGKVAGTTKNLIQDAWENWCRGTEYHPGMHEI